MGGPPFHKIQHAKERAELNGQWDVVEALNNLEHRERAKLAAVEEERARSQELSSSSSSSTLDSLSLPPTIAKKHTALALKKVPSSDYNYYCKSCEAKPSVAGPHHDNSCSKNQDALTLSSSLAHKHDCTHCGARPYVAGAHHRRDCPRRVKKHIEKSVAGSEYSYSTQCTHCGVKPFSQGSHHASSCKRHWSYSAYSTKKAHKYKCQSCGAKPFPAGPHHKKDCHRHFA